MQPRLPLVLLLAAQAGSEGPATLTEAVARLEKAADRLIRAAERKMDDGTAAFPPQVGTGYEAFWLRDYAYTLEGSIDSYSDGELTDACRLFVRSLRSDGAGVDCVRFDGTPVYMPGYGTMGEHPVADGSQFTVAVAWHTYRRTKDAALLQEIVGPLVRAMDAVPRNAETRLVHIAPGPGWDRCPYGFTDTIRKQGDVLFSSLLFVEAGRRLADLLREAGRTSDAAHWDREADAVADGVRRELWDGDVGLFRAATLRCREHDLWGSAFAVYLGVADEAQAESVAAYLARNYTGIVQHGQLRHLPAGVYWEEGCPRDTYQNGAFWATPVGWFVFTLDLAAPELADRTVIDLVEDFERGGVCEWVLGDVRRLPGYLASAALPLAGIRAMVRRRTGR